MEPIPDLSMAVQSAAALWRDLRRELSALDAAAGSEPPAAALIARLVDFAHICRHRITIQARSRPLDLTALTRAILDRRAAEVVAVEAMVEGRTLAELEAIIGHAAESLAVAVADLIADDAALVTAAGLVRSRLRLDGPTATRLRAALLAHGGPPEEALAELLPGAVLEAVRRDPSSLTLPGRVSRVIERGDKPDRLADAINRDPASIPGWLAAWMEAEQGRRVAPDDGADGLAELRDLFGRAGLGEREAAVWLLHAYGYKHREIADQLDMSINTVGPTLTAARRKLKRAASIP